MIASIATLSMTAVRFVDTNILLYAASTAPAEAVKAREARRILDATDLALSVQVLQEFFVQATRATRADRLTVQQAAGLVEAWLRFPVQEMSVTLMQAAIHAAARYRLAYWDAAIIEAARALRCETVLSEDLSHGRSFDGVTVKNPFRR